jgi:5-formyltetrahydrofolate cyclo-ligase
LTAPDAVLSGYYPIRSEIDPLPLLRDLHDRTMKIALPVIRPGPSLLFRHWAPGDVLFPRKYGLLEPGEANAQIDPNILLVPLLAFDRQGHRLGYGGGYYDAGLRALRKKGPILAVGVAYDEQEMNGIPREPQDEFLDFVLTPSGLIRCGE